MRGRVSGAFEREREMSRENQNLLRQLCVESCQELFEAYDVDLVIEDIEQPETCGLVGFIGFTNPELRGAFALAIERPPVAMGVEAANASDWVGELSNQLLGRFKNKLIGYGVILEMSTPLAMSGREISWITEFSHDNTIQFGSSNGAVIVYTDFEISSELELELVREPESAAMAEGELLFF